MSERSPLTIEQFYKFVAQRKLMGAKCKGCGHILAPPRSLCFKCHSSDLEWVELQGKGRVLTFTESHQASVPSLQSMVPYIVAIVELDDGPRLPGIIKNTKREDVKIGMRVMVDFDTEASEDWPHWARYYFVARG